MRGPELKLQQRHLFVENSEVSLCSNNIRDNRKGISVKVDHLGGMKHLCEDCKSSAEQYQHLYAIEDNNSNDSNLGDKILSALTYLILSAVLLAAIMIFTEGMEILNGILFTLPQ